jgi:hypothetical protein
MTYQTPDTHQRCAVSHLAPQAVQPERAGCGQPEAPTCPPPTLLQEFFSRGDTRHTTRTSHIVIVHAVLMMYCRRYNPEGQAAISPRHLPAPRATPQRQPAEPCALCGPKTPHGRQAARPTARTAAGSSSGGWQKWRRGAHEPHCCCCCCWVCGEATVGCGTLAEGQAAAGSTGPGCCCCCSSSSWRCW